MKWPFLFLLTGIAGCTKPPADECPDAANIAIHFTDPGGHNLFYNGSGYRTDSIVCRDIPQPYSSFQLSAYDSATNTAVFMPGMWSSPGYARFAVHFNRGADDTVRCHFNQDANSFCSLIDSVWYNSVLFTNSRGITIVRQ